MRRLIEVVHRRVGVALGDQTAIFVVTEERMGCETRTITGVVEQNDITPFQVLLGMSDDDRAFGQRTHHGPRLDGVNLDAVARRQKERTAKCDQHSDGPDGGVTKTLGHRLSPCRKA
ncbi:MAG: hypothetical protein JWP06_43 [Candidatus Saccharibacteria bacterium]|nr:hypothetical protein [Candidatus Saccharibacteria bacterium]